MSATRALVRKELDEIRGTWRWWAMPALLAFFGVTSPVMAALLPELAEYAAGETPGAVIKIPPPTALDAYVQFLGNLQQVGSLALVIIGAGIIAAEVRSGTAALTLCKPVSRGAYVLVKAAGLAATSLVATMAGSLVCVAVTSAVFAIGPFDRFLLAVGCWYVLALLLTAVATCLSAAMRSQIAAAIIGAVVVIGLAALSQLSVVSADTPAGLWTASTALLTGKPAALVVPLLSSCGLTVLLLVVAVRVFRHREI